MTVAEILDQIRNHSEKVRKEWTLQHDIETHTHGELSRLCVAILSRDSNLDPFSIGTQKWRRIMNLPYDTALIWCITLLIHEIQRHQSDHEYRS